MIEKTKNPNQRKYLIRRAIALGTLVLAGLGIYGATKGKAEQKPYIAGYEYVVQEGDSPIKIDQMAYPNHANHYPNSDKILASLPNDEFHAQGLQPGDMVVYPDSAHFDPGDEVKPVEIASSLKKKLPLVVPIAPPNSPTPKMYGEAAELVNSVRGTYVVPSGPPGLP